MTTGAPKPPARAVPKPAWSRSTSRRKELVFLQKVTRQEYHFITDDEQQARLKLRDKLVEAAFDQERGRVVLNLTRDELLFLIKVARENYSFIARAEKEARLALAAKLHKTAESVFGVTHPRRRLSPLRSFIVGTAGHIDHGKSALVRALTGTDPDRLKEEKERGITIDLGFAHAELGEGVVASFVDVPGHERFVRNMLAGAHGIDAVAPGGGGRRVGDAADARALPHLPPARRSRAASSSLTKCDARRRRHARRSPSSRRASSWRARSSRAGPSLRVSARTGEGLAALRAALLALAREAPPRAGRGPPAAAGRPRLLAEGLRHRGHRDARRGRASRAGDEVEVAALGPARAGARAAGPRRDGRAGSRPARARP